MRKGVVTHSTIDNNDGREDTMTGFGTTHDTNSTLFQLPTVKEHTTMSTILQENDSIDFNLQEADNFAKEILPYNIGKRVGVFVNRFSQYLRMKNLLKPAHGLVTKN